MVLPGTDQRATSQAVLPWEARPGPALLSLALPITLGGLSFASMGVVDALLVGQLGAAQLAGVGLGLVVTNGLMGFGFGVLRGVKVLLAQARGRGASACVARYVGAGLWVAFGLGGAMLVLGECAAWIVPRFAASVEAGEAARRYIAVRSLGMPVILAYVALREARYGLGETRSPLISALLGNLAHALLDYLALYQLRWGAAGAATANVLAFLLQALLLWSVHRESGIELGVPARAAQGEVVREGAFTGLQFALEILSFGVLSLILAGVSDHHMAAHQIGAQLAAFCFLPALAIAESATVLAAEAVGRGRLAVVYEVAHAARRLALAYAGLCALILGLGAVWLARWFTSDELLRSVLRPVLVTVAIHQALEALALSGHGVLRGVGAARLSALCALGCAWLCTPWLGYALVHVAGLGVIGAWLARAFEFACAATIVWRYLESGRWERAHLRTDPPALDLASSRPRTA